MSEFKFINLLKNRNIAKILSAGIAVAVLCSVMAIPVSASETEWVQVDLTPSDLFNIFAGSISSLITFSHVSAPVFTTYDLLNSTTITQPFVSSSNVFLFLEENGVLFYFPYIFEYRLMSNVVVDYTFDLDLPFSYRFISDSSITSDNIVVEFLIGAPSSLIRSSSMDLLYDVNGTTYSSSGSLTPIGDYRFSSLSYFYEPYVNSFPWLSGLSNLQQSPVYDVNFIFDPSSDDIVSSLSFSFSASLTSSYGNTLQYIQVPALYMKGFSVLVPKEIASDVNEYLDIITGSPTPEQSVRISELEDKFSKIDEDLEQAASDLEVDVPDISDVDSTIPEELTQGNEIVSEQVLSPILNAQPIVTIFLGLFAIVSLKLFLFGSGPH